jgi:hypothetical protein
MNTLAPLADLALILTPFVTTGYIALCAIWPFKACRTCHGTGHILGPFGGIRLCRRCHATGLRLRLGRRIWNAFTRLYRELRNR